MSNVLMLHGPIQLVCKFIFFHVFLSNNKIFDCKMNAISILAINTPSYINLISMAARGTAA